MNLKAFLIGLFLSGIAISHHSLCAQSPKGQLIEIMKEYVGMMDYDGKTFFIGNISNIGGSKIRLTSQEEFADPNQLILDLSRIKTSSLSVKRATSPGISEFEHYEVKFEGKGSIYEPSSFEENKLYTAINICLAGKEVFKATTTDNTVAQNVLNHLKEAAIEAKSAKKEAVAKKYTILNEQALIAGILKTKGVSFEANNTNGRYVIIHGGMREFFGDVKTICINIDTEKPIEEIHPDVSVDIIYILVRTHMGKRETVAEIPRVFPNREFPPTCCKDCFSFPESETFPSGAYEVFMYLGEEQTRKLGNFVFAVK